MSSGNWQGRARVRGKALTFSHEDRKEVEKWLDRQAARRRSSSTADPLDERTPVADLWAIYQRRVRPRSLVRYRSLWKNHLEPVWATMRACDLKRWMVQDWVDDDLARLAPATVESCVALLSGIMRMGVEREMLDTNPVRGVIKPAKVSKPMVLPTPAELTELIDALPPYLRMVAVFGACGMRFGEAAGVTRAQIDLARGPHGAVWVNEQVYPDGSRGAPKSRRDHDATRWVPLTAWARAHLDAHMADRAMLPAAYVTAARRAVAIRSDVFRYQWGKAQVAVYGEHRGMTHKTLRHFYISMLDEGGQSEAAIQRTVGHRIGSRVTKQSYTHPTDKADARTVGILNAAFARETRVESEAKER
jgi:integrase